MIAQCGRLNIPRERQTTTTTRPTCVIGTSAVIKTRTTPNKRNIQARTQTDKLPSEVGGKLFF